MGPEPLEPSRKADVFIGYIVYDDGFGSDEPHMVWSSSMSSFDVVVVNGGAIHNVPTHILNICMKGFDKRKKKEKI